MLGAKNDERMWILTDRELRSRDGPRAHRSKSPDLLQSDWDLGLTVPSPEVGESRACARYQGGFMLTVLAAATPLTGTPVREPE